MKVKVIKQTRVNGKAAFPGDEIVVDTNMHTLENALHNGILELIEEPKIEKDLVVEAAVDTGPEDDFEIEEDFEIEDATPVKPAKTQKKKTGKK